MQITKEGLQADLENLKKALAQKASECDQIIGRIQAVESILSALDAPEPKKESGENGTN